MGFGFRVQVRWLEKAQVDVLFLGFWVGLTYRDGKPATQGHNPTSKRPSKAASGVGAPSPKRALAQYRGLLN